MSMVIGTNISSLTAQRHLASSKNDMENAMERLASGNRINSSRDDAAGMAIAGRMESQISGLNQSVRNANDGIALAQSAEGALDETTSILQRMRDLSVQASSATLTTSDRSSVQAEVTALTAELDRISSTTKFNNISLLAGTATGLQFQVGAGAGENVSLTIGSASASDLGLAGTNTGNTGALAGGRMATLNGLNGNDVQINGVDWIENNNAAVTATVTVNNAAGVSTDAKTSTAAGVAMIINSGTAAHGATATASNLVKGTVASGLVVATDLTINSAAISTSANLAELVTNINNEASDAKARLNATGDAIELYNTTGETIIVGGTILNTGLTQTSYIGFLDLTNSDGSKTLITKGDNLGAKVADVNAMGFNTRGSASSITGSSINAATDLGLTDDLTINGIAVGPSTNNGQPSASNVAAQLNTYSAQTNVLASANTKVTLAIDTTMAAGVATSTNVGATEEMTINGVQIIFTTATQTMAQMVTKVNDKLSAAGQGGITATADGSNLILESLGGQTISITDTDQGATLFTRADGSTVNATATLTDFTGQITLTNTAGGDVTFGTVTGTEAELDTTLALLGMHQQGSTTGSTSTTGLSMASTTAASAAITAIDAAIEKVFVSRGALGAFQNRLDHTVSNLRNVSENMSFSKSQIMDTDFATESANLAKAQVLQQAGTAMLAQANASGQSVLSLLK
jgi:flagellin